MIIVFKVCEKDEWEEVKDRDFFKGSKNDQSDGFIHISTSEQLKGTLEKYFKLKSYLYLLVYHLPYSKQLLMKHHFLDHEFLRSA